MNWSEIIVLPCYQNNKHERPFLWKYQQLQKYKLEDDRLCHSSSGDLKILAELMVKYLQIRAK